MSRDGQWSCEGSGAQILWERLREWGLFSLEEAQGRLLLLCATPEGKQWGEGGGGGQPLLPGNSRTRKEMALDCTGGVRLGPRKHFFSGRVVMQWHRLHREVWSHGSQRCSLRRGSL